MKTQEEKLGGKSCCAMVTGLPRHQTSADYSVSHVTQGAPAADQSQLSETPIGATVGGESAN